MSIHVQLSMEAETALAKQKRNSTITSTIIAICMVFLLGLILFVIGLAVEVKKTPEIIAYAVGVGDTEVVEKAKASTQVERKPASPSSSMAKVIAASLSSATAVSVPVIEVAEASMDFGNGDDFGEGWADGDGFGSGGGSNGASFFNQKVKANRVCFVIDYSASMRGLRIALLKKELAQSVKKLPTGMEYQMIFFGGPAWVAGSTVKMAQGNKSAVITHEDKTYKWAGRSAHGWVSTGRMPKVSWRESSKSNIKESLSAIEETPLVWGTTWTNPLEMALDMNPRPDVIFFMTDGSSGKSSKNIALRMGERAKSLGITINAIALMDPVAKEAMGAIAELSGGQFSMVSKDGSTKVILKGKSE